MIRDDFDAVIEQLLADHAGTWAALAESEKQDMAKNWGFGVTIEKGEKSVEAKDIIPPQGGTGAVRKRILHCCNPNCEACGPLPEGDPMTYGSSIPDDFKGILSQPARDKPAPLSASQLQKILDDSPHVVPLADGTYYLLPGNLKRKD